MTQRKAQVLPVLFSTDELPQALTVVNEAHNVTNLVSKVVLPGADKVPFCFLIGRSLFLCVDFITPSLLSLLSFLLVSLELGLRFFGQLPPPLVGSCLLLADFLGNALLVLQNHLLPALLSHTHPVVQI